MKLARRKQIQFPFAVRSFGLLLLLLFFFTGCYSLKLERADSANIRLDSTLKIAPDAKMTAVIRPYQLKLANDMGEVLCLSDAPLIGERPESPLTNFCADLVLIESDSICLKKYSDIDIDLSMVNRGGLRIPIPQGEVKVQHMFELMPFENELVFLKLSGTELRLFLDHIAYRGGEGVAGIRFGIRNDKCVDPQINGQPIVETKSYWLATSDYIANGGDDFEFLVNIKDRLFPGLKFRDMFIDHLRKMGRKGVSINAKVDGRIYNAQ